MSTSCIFCSCHDGVLDTQAMQTCDLYIQQYQGDMTATAQTGHLCDKHRAKHVAALPQLQKTVQSRLTTGSATGKSEEKVVADVFMPHYKELARYQPNVSGGCCIVM